MGKPQNMGARVGGEMQGGHTQMPHPRRRPHFVTDFSECSGKRDKHPFAVYWTNRSMKKLVKLLTFACVLASTTYALDVRVELIVASA